MKIMSLEEIKIKKGMGRKVYIKNSYAWIGKYYSSKFWNPFDWYIVKIDKNK